MQAPLSSTTYKKKDVNIHIDNVTAPANEHFLIPRILNPLFTGRTEIVKKMQIALSAREGSYGQQKRFVLTGLGGQGKSEICIKVANLVRQK